MLCSFLCFCVVLCGFVCICAVFVYILYRFCIPTPRLWLLCVYFVVSVCIVYTVSRFGVFVQCVLCPMCTNPVFHCLQCVPNELFIKVPRLGVPKVHIVHTPVLAC